jgi:hypothetical protein
MTRRDAAMLNYYLTLKKRMKGQKASIRVARKLLRRIRAVMLSGKPYVKGVRGNTMRGQAEAPLRVLFGYSIKVYSVVAGKEEDCKNYKNN